MKRLLGIGCLMVALATAAPAAADSLVFSRDNNVWLANADGTGQYQVTLDGTFSDRQFLPTAEKGFNIPFQLFALNGHAVILSEQNDGT